jgi:hypothetical protein
MAVTTVTLSQSGSDIEISYDPSNVVRRGDTVTFECLILGAAVTVGFGPDNCFSSGSENLSLEGGSQTAASGSQIVNMRAAPGEYPFTVDVTLPPGSEQSGGGRFGGNLESKTGALDVTTDPPPPPEE